ncbi:hypothetical protein CCACVL1_03217, partial [Corchorus capsularis]
KKTLRLAVKRVASGGAGIVERTRGTREAGTEQPKFSWKDMVVGNLDTNGLNDRDEFGPLTQNKDLITVSTKDSWLSLTTSDKLKERLNRGWTNCLIVKLLGRSIGFKTLDERVRRMWMPRAEFELIDLGFFILSC